MELVVGDEIDGRYVIAGEIGVGGIARVYAATDARLDVPVALKVLMVPAAAGRKRMQREGRAQATLRHPNVVQVTDIIDVRGTLGLVMDLVRGPSLAELLARHRLTVDEAVTLAHGIVSGVGAAHGHGLIHRDLKPHNVLLHTEGSRVVPRVADFGLVKAVASNDPSSTVTRTGATMGSPRYMSPEQVRDASKVDQRTDMFSLGCVIYEMLCAAPAFPGEDTWEVFNAIMAGEFQAPRELAELPDHVAAVVEACLEPDLDKRLASCDELLDALGEPEPDPWRPETLAAIASFVDQLPALAVPEAETWQGTFQTQEEHPPAAPALPPLPAPRPRPKPRGSTLNIGLLEGASDRDRIMALRHLKPAVVPADTVLMEEGDEDPSLLVLLEGAVELRRGQVDIGEAGPGDLVGATDLLTGEPRFATVRTLEDTKLLVLHAAGFEALAAAGNHVAHTIELAAVVQMARRVRSMESALALVAPADPMPEIATEDAGFFGRLRGAVGASEPDHPIDIAATLRHHPALRDCPDDVLSSLAGAFRQAHAKPGTPIFQAGGPTRRLYVHARGRVRALLPVGDRGVTPLESPLPGWPFGVAALFDDAPHRWSAIADGGVHVLAMGLDGWTDLLEAPDAVGSAFRRMLAYTLRRRYVAMMVEAVGHEIARRKVSHAEVARLMGADAEAIPESQFRHFGIGGHRR